MATWSPITQAEMERLLQNELSSCSANEREVYTRIRIPMRAVPIERMGNVESVFAIGENDAHLLIFEDVEQGFEWCRQDVDGVIRDYGCDQAGLQPRLHELLNREQRESGATRTTSK